MSPSQSQHSAEIDREGFPKLRDRIGEDPARFLDHDLVSNADMKRMTFARIRGIDEIEVVRVWIAVERQLDRGPRKAIIESLQAREERLEEIGERPDRLEFGPRRPPGFFESESADRDRGEENLSAHDKLARMRADGGH